VFEGVSDGELVDVMSEASRDESTAIALRLLAVGELYARHVRERAECSWWVSDPTAGVAAEVSAATNISHARAVAQVHYGRVLRERLVEVAKLFVRGTIDFRVVSMIIARTENVDDALMPALDAAIARHAEKWMKLSEPKLRDRVDLWVSRFDPAGVRVAPKVEERRFVEFGPGDSAGMADMWGTLRAADGAALQARLDAVAATVCADDPRSAAQRRADACGAVGRGQAALACQCGAEDCPAGAERTGAVGAVIHVLAEQATLDGSSDRPGYLPGFGILPADSVRELADTALLTPVPVPSGAHADAGYRPRAATLEFIRWRDLTCRWPGCDRPAERCDIDHTIPWPYGPTHPSNNKPYCRTHHLIKTFCGWTDQQLPDGTLMLTSPTGHTYTSEAHGAAMFPTLAQPTGELDTTPYSARADTDRSAMMPRRKQTRDQDRRDRINAERRQRGKLIAEEEQQRQAWLATNYQPPPF
jgi:hypothetical protein